MKIKDIKLFTIKAGWKPWSFLKIETDSKIVGWSETTDTFGNENGFRGVLRDYKNLLVGENPREINKLIWKLETTTKSNSGSIVRRVIAGIENALWDIAGKYCQLPVYELLKWVYPKLNNSPVLLERDFNFPEINELKS